tara:strand:- start:1724 stop:2023 length:300 start_codon:yes stop_codon:yes gene_type:complete
MSDKHKADVIDFLERKAKYTPQEIVRFRLQSLTEEQVVISDVGILKKREKIILVIAQSDYGENPPQVDTVMFDIDELPSVIETLTDAYEFVTLGRRGEE